MLYSDEFLKEAIAPSFEADGVINQETLKEKMKAIFKKDYNSFDNGKLEKLAEIASRHISSTMIEKVKLYLAVKEINIEAPTFAIEDINIELLKQLPLSKISDYLVAIKAGDKFIKEILEKVIPNESGTPSEHSVSYEIDGLIASSEKKIKNGIQYKSEDIAFDPSFVPIESSYSATMEENVKFQLEACQKIEDEGIDKFPLAKLIYGHMKNFDSSNPESFNGSEQHLFRFFGSQFKNYTNYVESLSPIEEKFSSLLTNYCC